MHLRINYRAIGFLIVVVLVFGALFGTGVLDWKYWRSWTRLQAQGVRARAAQGVSLEGPKAGSDAMRLAEQCRANLRRIEGAKRSIAQKTGNAVVNPETQDVLKELGGQPPQCPSGGRYLLGSNTVTARCTVGGNGTLDQGDDHLLAMF